MKKHEKNKSKNKHVFGVWHIPKNTKVKSIDCIKSEKPKPQYHLGVEIEETRANYGS